MFMQAIYDLARNPPTYDVISFLAHAEWERRRLGVDRINIRILPGPNHGFRKDSLWPFSPARRWLMLKNVVVPACKMLPNSTVDVRTDRQHAPGAFGFNDYKIGLKNILAVLRQGIRPLRVEVPYQKNPKLITFTLREAEHWPLRNSNVPEWERASVLLRARGYEVQVIRDTSVALTSVGNASWCELPKASCNLQERARVYASAHVNIGISNGPMWFAVFADLPVLMLRPTTNEARGCYDNAFYSRQGLKPGEQLPESPPYQRLVWKTDTAENIVSAVEEYVGY